MDNQLSFPREAEPLRYNTYVLMNKPVYFWGFTSYQLLACFGPIFFIAIISFGIFHILYGSIILGILVTPVICLMRIIRKENSKGNPNYLASWFLAKKAPGAITDRDNVMAKLYRNNKKYKYT